MTTPGNMFSPESIMPCVPRPEQRRVLQFGVVAAVVTATGIAGILSALGGKGHPAPPQHDVLMYLQYARAIAEGRPYEYQPGDPPSTGSTSHLYPAVLAVFHILGFREENLLLVSLGLNASLFVVTVALTGYLAAAMFPHLTWLAMALTMFSGPLMLGVFGQTDMGLFMVCALGVWTALLYGRPLSAWAAMTAAVWTRPEGVLVALALAAGSAPFLRSHRRAAAWFALGLWGLAQFALVLSWNHWLTGHVTFHSVLGKGYWVWHPATGAVNRTLRDAAHLISGIFFNAPAHRYTFRALYGVPILSGTLAIIGWIRWIRDQQPARRLVAWGMLFMLGMAFAVTAASGWQGFFYDRHLAWIFSFLAVLTAGGTHWVYEQRLRSPRTSRTPLLSLLLVGYTLLMFPFFVSTLRGAATTTNTQMVFVKQVVSAQVPEGAGIGVLNFPGLAYVLPRNKLIHLGGYISPRFASQGDFISSLDILKNEPERRFDFWLLAGLKRKHPTLQAVFGPMLASETDVFPDNIRLALLRADFTCLTEPTAATLLHAAGENTDWELADRLDVGYDKDEQAHAYTVQDRDPRRRVEPGFAIRVLREGHVGDVGRVIFGEELFRLRVRPHSKAYLVWRTGDSLIVNARYDDQVLPFRTVTLGTNMSCRVTVNGQQVGEIRGAALAADRFEEVVFEIADNLLSNDTLNVRAEGDHISFGWRLYQPRSE